MSDRKKTFVNAVAMLDNLRDNNMTTHESVCELIDNSMDHSARNVWVEFDKNPKTGQIWLIVQDDGDGIPKEKLQDALALGGTFNPRHSEKIGRFGMGLSSACASQSPLSVLASKTKAQKAIWCNEINFEYLKAHDCEFPEDYILEDNVLKSKVKFKESGTLVYWTVCDNLDQKKPASLQKHLIDTISRVYRHFINADRKIFVNGTEVVLSDPLCRLEKHRFANEYGTQKLFGTPINIPIKYVDDDDKTEKESTVVVELVLLDYEKLQKNDELAKKIQPNMRSQGLYLIRNNRELDNPQWYQTTLQKDDWHNYIRGEIRFDSCLDKLFGIGHNKSRAYPKDIVLESLKELVSPRVTEMLSQHKRVVKQYKETVEGGSSKAKDIFEKGTTIKIPDPKVDIRIDNKGDVKVEEPKTKEEVQTDLTRRVETNPVITPDAKEKRKAAIKQVLEDKYPVGIVVMNDGATAPIFRIEKVDGKDIILINADHKFYEFVYEPAAQSPYAHPLIDLVFYVMSDVRNSLGKPEYIMLFDEVMSRFSKTYGIMLNQKEFAELVGEAQAD